jgi:acetolactate synthase-1/2/3 large subunit
MATMTGHQYFAQAMKAYGITHVFFVPTILTEAQAEMGDLGIVSVMTHGERPPRTWQMAMLARP